MPDPPALERLVQRSGDLPFERALLNLVAFNDSPATTEFAVRAVLATCIGAWHYPGLAGRSERQEVRWHVRWLSVGSVRGLWLDIQRCLDALTPRQYIVFELGDEGDRRGERYVQAKHCETYLHLESISNQYLSPALRGAVPLTTEEEGLLAHSGWQPPSESCPNWSRDLFLELNGATALSADLLVRALVDAHGWIPGSWISYEVGS